MHKYDEKILLVKYRKNTEKKPTKTPNEFFARKKTNPTTQIRIFWSRMKTKSFCILFSIRENAFKIPH